jgi:hypothetical protein
MQAPLVVKALTLSTASADLTENTPTCITAMQTLKLYSALLPNPLQYAHLLQLKTHFMTVSR